MLLWVVKINGEDLRSEKEAKKGTDLFLMAKFPTSSDVSGIIVQKQIVINTLNTHKSALAERFGVTDLALFGSTARDTARKDSDVDILVSFNGPATSKRYFGVQFYLEDLLNCPIDLVTTKALRPELRPFVEREAIHV